MKVKHLLIALLILSACSSQRKITSPYGTFTDERDGHVYKTVKIGGTGFRIAKNLAYDFENGKSIARSEYYDRNPQNRWSTSRLYSSFDALLQGAACKGWHVPWDTK